MKVFDLTKLENISHPWFFSTAVWSLCLLSAVERVNWCLCKLLQNWLRWARFDIFEQLLYLWNNLAFWTVWILWYILEWRLIHSATKADAHFVCLFSLSLPPSHTHTHTHTFWFTLLSVWVEGGGGGGENCKKDIPSFLGFVDIWIREQLVNLAEFCFKSCHCPFLWKQFDIVLWELKPLYGGLLKCLHANFNQPWWLSG